MLNYIILYQILVNIILWVNLLLNHWEQQYGECLLCSSIAKSKASHSFKHILHQGQMTLSPSPV